MIRTRDFLVFAFALVFLVTGIGATWLTQSFKASGQTATVVNFNEAGNAQMSGAVAVSDTVPREENIARLQQKIAKGEGDVAAGDPVFTSVDDVVVMNDADHPAAPGQVLSCSSRRDDSAWLASWPTVRSVEEVEGARIVTVGNQTILQLPLLPTRQPSASCVAGEVTGITIHGGLIRNDTADIYKDAGENDLIGWALDGFPIYGARANGVLDACGGSDEGLGYRYHIRENENTVLNCFAGSPVR